MLFTVPQKKRGETQDSDREGCSTPSATPRVKSATAGRSTKRPLSPGGGADTSHATPSAPSRRVADSKMSACKAPVTTRRPQAVKETTGTKGGK
jgi:hypothetical protein